MKNETKYYLMTVLYALVTLSGSVLQAFLLELGLSAEMVSVYISVTQIVQVAVMLSLGGWIERAKNIIFLCAATMGTQMLMFLLLLFFSFFPQGSDLFKTILVYGIGIPVNVAIGVYGIVSYKFPYRVIDMRKYGTITGISGALGGAAGIVLSALMTYFVARYPYFSVMKIVMVLGIISAIACFLVTTSCKDTGFSMGEKEKKRINLFTYKPFWMLLVPNLFRGIHGGIYGISVAIGYHLKLLNSTTATILLVITNVATILSSLLYSLVARKQKIEKWLILIPAITMLVTMTWMVSGGSTIFLVMYTITYVAFHIINNAVPVGLTKVIDYEIIGQFSAWRMACFSLGTAIAGMIAIPLIDAIGGTAVMMLAGIFQLVSSGIYFWYMKKSGQ